MAPKKEKKPSINKLQKKILEDYKKEHNIVKEEKAPETKPEEKKVETRGRKSTQYLTTAQLMAHLTEMKKTGFISEDLGKCFITLVRKISGHSEFRFYPVEIQKDLESAALERLVGYVHNIDLNRPNCKPFAYLTEIVKNSHYYYLKNHYKQLNIKKALAEQYLQEMAEEVSMDESCQYIYKAFNQQAQTGEH